MKLHRAGAAIRPTKPGPAPAPSRGVTMTPDGERQALAIMLAITALAVAADVWLYQTYGADGTFSRVCRRAFQRWPSLYVGLVFWMGVLVGHIWLPE
jgi:hypothetical protein